MKLPSPSFPLLRSLLRSLLPAAAVVMLALPGCQCAEKDTCDPLSCDEGQECDADTDTCAPIECIPGLTRCSPLSPQALERCNSTGDDWFSVGTCGPGQTCVAGTVGSTCDPPACAPGVSMCGVDGMVSYCAVGVFENPVACPAGEVCDPAQGTTCTPTVCAPSTTFCDTEVDEVRDCNALGTASTLVETCGSGEECDAGRCFGLCDLAEVKHSFVGCTYYGVDLNNYSSDDMGQYDIVVANPQDSITANVTIAVRNPSGGAWTPVAASSVAPGTVWLSPLPDRHAEGTALVPALAYRVTSDVPIVAYQINSDDLSIGAASSGASILFPRAALGTSYYAMGLPTVLVNGFGGEPIARAGVAVVGVTDNTNIVVTVSTNTLPAPGVPAMVAGDSYATTLNEGDVFQIEAAEVGDDVTGTFVYAMDKAVSVFSYHEGAVTSGGYGGHDHYEEQMLPLEAWGLEFPSARQTSDYPDMIWRIIASEPDTTVTFEYGGSTTGLPVVSGGSILLGEAEWVEYVVTGDFYCSADKPIQIAQWTMPDPSMVIGVPRDQFLEEYLFLAPPGFSDTITVIRYNTSTIMLDGLVLPSSTFVPIAAGFEVHREPLPTGSHTISGAAPSEFEGPPGVHVWGNGGGCEYGYIGGLDLERINPIE